MNYRTILLLGLLFAFVRSPANASCPDKYLDGTWPTPTPPDVVELCNDEFADLWDPARRNPRYAAEVLYAKKLRAFTERTNDFHTDPRLEGRGQPSVTEFSGTGYDRGHMAPAGDMSTAAAMRQSFSMANMVPQVAANNRGPWSRIEEAVRSLVVPVKDGRGFVVTGPLYWGDVQKVGASYVPSKLFKALYVPGDMFGNQVVVGAWLVDNAERPDTAFISLARLRDVYGVDAFPSLPEGLKAAAQVPEAVLVRTQAVRR